MTYILTHTFLNRAWKWLTLFVLLITVAVFSSGTAAAAAPSLNVSVYATGLDNPRGLKFGPNGDLYVAEGGTGGSHSTVGQSAMTFGPDG